MTILTDITLNNDISTLKLGHAVTLICDVSELTNTYTEYKLYSITNETLTLIEDLTDNITNGILIYKYYPQTTGTINLLIQTEEQNETQHRSNTITLNINNNSHAQNIYTAGQLLTTNLETKGVTASANEGLTTLINKVLDIEASVGGIEVYTHINLTSTQNTCYVGDTCTLSGVLEADKDDETVANIDLEGYLKNAPVKIYNGNQLITTIYTDSNGAYTYNHIPTTSGSQVLTAVFEGTDDYQTCTSNTVNLTVNPINLTLTSDKNTANVNELVTFTATLTDENDNPITGKNIDFIDDDNNIIGTATTDSNGTCNVSYSWEHTSTLYIHAKYYDFVSSNLSVNIISFIIEFTGNKLILNNKIRHSGVVIIDWSDGNTDTYEDNSISHTYNTSDNYTIEIIGNIKSIKSCSTNNALFYDSYNTQLACTINTVSFPAITSIGTYALMGCANVTSINIPNTVISIGEKALMGNYANVILNWTDSSTILQYSDRWAYNSNSIGSFTIPPNTADLYTAKGYPASKLVEASS